MKNTAKFADNTIALENKLGKVLSDIEKISDSDSANQLFMLIPRLKYIQKLSEDTEKKIKDQIQETNESLTLNVLNQQSASIDILQKQISDMIDTINLATFAIQTSEKQKACSKAILLAERLKTQFKNLEKEHA